MLLQKKYLKYKGRYLNLKNQFSGNNQAAGSGTTSTNPVIFDILVIRKNPENKCLVKKNNILVADYLSSYVQNEDKSNFNVLDNNYFKDWCNCLSGGTMYNDNQTMNICNELWTFLIGHFQDLATYDKADPMGTENKENDKIKLIRRWTEYFNKSPQQDIEKKPEISLEELQAIFCAHFKKVVQEVIKERESYVTKEYPLHYFFYTKLRNLK